MIRVVRMIQRERQEKHALTARELAGYRQWLAELDQEAREEGGDPARRDPELRRYFDPYTPCGRQVYESYTDGELLDILIRTMERPGHSPRYGEVYCFYLDYIRLRFQGLNNAKELARGRLKRRELRKRWPPDWHERVTAEPVVEQLRRRGRSGPELELPRRICESCRKTGLPPELTAEERQALERLGCGDAASVLRCMGIPVVNKTLMRHLRRYWQEAREKQTDDGEVTV